MSVSISGILLDPFGQPASFAEVKFITWQGANDVLTTAPAVFKTSAGGAYSFAVEFGTFTVQVRYNQSNGKFQTIKQKVVVNSNVTATTLGELLLFNEPLTPPEIAYVEQLVAEAEGYRDEAEGFAAASEASSQTSATSAAASAQSAADAANSAALIAPVPLNGGVWASGQTYDFYNQYMIYNGEAYSPLPATVLPYTVGAVPDLGFVYQIKLNDHSLLANRDAVGAHDSIYRRETTTTEIGSGVFSVGDNLTIIDRGNAPVIVVAGVSADGYGSIDAGNGNRTLLIENGECYLDWFGTQGDSIADDWDAIQACLNYKYTKDLSTPFTPTTQWTVKVRKGTYRYTKQIHQPSGVQVIGTNPISLQGLTNLDLTVETMTRFYADFPYEEVDTPSVGDKWTKKSSWLISGFSLDAIQTGVPVGDLMDPYLHSMAGAIFDNGYYTRSFYCALKGVMFYTDKNVANAVGVGGHPNLELEISTHGFLFGSCTQSAWGSQYKLRGEVYHCGAIATTINASTVSDYLNKTSTVPVDVPTMGATTVPFQWQESSNTGHPIGDFYLTTGIYITFSTGVSIPVTTNEKWQRGGVIWNSKVSIDTLYLEAVTNLGFTAVSCDLSVDTITANIIGSNGLFKSNDSASVNLPNFTNNEKTKISAGGGGSFPRPRNYVFISNPDNINSDEVFYGGLMIRTSRSPQEEKIYTSSGGNDANTGKGINNPVLTMERAIERAQFYDVGRIVVADGETVLFNAAGSTTKDANITIESESGAIVSCALSGNNLASNILQNSHLNFKNVDVVVPISPGTPSTDFRGMFIPNGDSSITIEDGNVTANSVNNGIFSTGAGKAGRLTISLINATLTASNMSVNGSTSGTGVRYLYNIDTLSSASGSQNWSSEFTGL